MLKVFKKLFPTNTSSTKKTTPTYFYPIGEINEGNSVYENVKEFTRTIEKDSGISINNDEWDEMFNSYSVGIPPNYSQLNEDMQITDNLLKLNNWE